MSHFSFDLALACLDDTAELAQRFSKVLKPGDVMLLDGDIGMGKSFFARCLIQSSQDIPEDVPSPTFTIVQTYDTEIGEIWHTDLYRLSGADDIIELGLLDAFETSICLVEWPDRLETLVPQSALRLRFSPGPTDDARHVHVTWTQAEWTTRLEPFTHA